MASDNLAQTDCGDAAPNGFSIDSANPKYRQFTNSGGILEYTAHGEELTVDWVCGRNALLMIHAVLDYEGTKVRKVSGYVTDKLGAVPDAALTRIASRLARGLGGGWIVTVQRIEGRRYLMLTR